MPATATQKINTAERDAWLRTLDKLAANTQKWAKEKNWDVEVEEKEFDERDLGHYKAKAIRVKADNGYLTLEPVAKRVLGGEGLVDVHSFPAGNYVHLFLNGTKWRIRTDSNLDWPSPWNKKNFFLLAKELNAIR